MIQDSIIRDDKVCVIGTNIEPVKPVVEKKELEEGLGVRQCKI